MDNLSRRYHSCPHRDFNTTLKHVLRALRAKLPGMDGTLAFMLASYKMMKTVNRRWPQRYFAEALGAHAERIAARDEAFFNDPASFEVPGNEQVVGEVRAGWKLLSAADKAFVWDCCDALLAKAAAAREHAAATAR